MKNFIFLHKICRDKKDHIHNPVSAAFFDGVGADGRTAENAQKRNQGGAALAAKRHFKGYLRTLGV